MEWLNHTHLNVPYKGSNCTAERAQDKKSAVSFQKDSYKNSYHCAFLAQKNKDFSHGARPLKYVSHDII